VRILVFVGFCFYRGLNATTHTSKIASPTNKGRLDYEVTIEFGDVVGNAGKRYIQTELQGEEKNTRLSDQKLLSIHVATDSRGRVII
jgi:hypothetical protein